MDLPSRMIKGAPKGSFVFRVRMGEYEVEISGEREEVVKTIRELPSLMAGVHKAFEVPKPQATATLTVKTSPAKKDTPVEKYPKISGAESCGEAVLSILETDWGKWRPRTVSELKEALKANEMNYPGRTLAGVLFGLVRKGTVKRWKTDSGCVYILTEEEVLA